MKTIKTFFVILLTAALAGCGGGGGGGGNTTDNSTVADTPTVNPTLRSIDRIATGFNFPAIPNTNGYVVVKGSELYVSDSSSIKNLNFSGQVLSTFSVNDPRGMAVSGSDLYYAANPTSSNSNIYRYPDQISRQITNIAYNFGSLSILGNDLYAVDYSGSGQVSRFTNKLGNASAVFSGPSYITSDSTYVYVTKVSGGVGVVDQSGNAHSLNWQGITNPKGIAIAGSYAFIVSQADISGNGAVIFRVKLTDGTVDTYVDGQTSGVWDSSLDKGFCGPTGIAANTQDGYLYVVNGYCTGASAATGNRNSLIRIKI